MANGVVTGVVSTGNEYRDTRYPVSVLTRATDVPAARLN